MNSSSGAGGQPGTTATTRTGTYDAGHVEIERTCSSGPAAFVRALNRLRYAEQAAQLRLRAAQRRRAEVRRLVASGRHPDSGDELAVSVALLTADDMVWAAERDVRLAGVARR